MPDKFSIENLLSIERPYMWIGFIVGFAVAVLLYMLSVIKPGLKKCVKEYPQNCSSKSNLIPLNASCETGAEDNCSGDLICKATSGSGGPIGGPGTCRPR